ncbi:M56 family metallopeptidase [Prosthecobacter sp.]|uniref:M56 family metallopeptidase n=1 Tax=Prosthecobacter sp. TaxID=1965333 RepID=UPI003784B471
MNMLTQLFDWLLTASLRASLLTLAALLIQAALHRHLSARMRYALWLPVLVVLLMPVLPQSRWSIEQVFQAPPPAFDPMPLADLPSVVRSASETPVLPSPPPAPINWQAACQLTWAGISSAMLVFGCLSFVLTLRRFKQARQPASAELLATLAQISREIHLRQVPRVMIAPCISSPAVTGFLRPTLLLPAEFDREFTPEEARLVLRHELMHLKRGDLPLNAVMCVLMALHWFNPLLWIAFFKIRADREAACDAQVLHDAPNDRRIAYGHALLKVETAFCPRGLSLGFVGIFQRGAALRSRIRSIATHRAPHPVMRFFICLCIVLMTFLGITRAQQPKPAGSAPIIAIEMRIIEFKKPTEWNFGGKLPAEETLSFIYEEVSAETLAVQLREMLKDENARTTAYPRMVTADKNKIVVRSIVNTPFKGGYLPIGLVCKFTPALHGTQVRLDVDITDSDLIDPATGAVVSEVKGDHPTTRSRVYRGSHEIQDGHSCIIAGWENGKPEGKLPLLYVITPHVISPGKDGLPADAGAAPKSETSRDFAIGQSSFRPGDSIVITSVKRSADMLTVGLDYELASTGEATAALYLTSAMKAADEKSPPFNAKQHAVVKRGRGSVVLQHPLPAQGLPHVTLYDREHQPIGGIYFGSTKEAADSRAFQLNYMTPSASGEIVITAQETSIDPATKIQTAKGDARCKVGEISIQAAELVCDPRAQQLKIRGPFTLMLGSGKKHSSTSSESSAVLDLASGKLTTMGPHETEIVTTPATNQVTSRAVEAELKAAELRKARPQQYDFNKAILGDVVRFLATDARIDFIALPDDNPIGQRLTTFSLRGSPFEVLETICRANSLMLVLDHERWLIRPSDDADLIEKHYSLPETRAGVEDILRDITLLLGSEEARPAKGLPRPSVAFDKEKNSFSVKGTRLQQTWIAGYFTGLSGLAQARNAK